MYDVSLSDASFLCSNTDFDGSQSLRSLSLQNFIWKSDPRFSIGLGQAQWDPEVGSSSLGESSWLDLHLSRFILDMMASCLNETPPIDSLSPRTHQLYLSTGWLWRKKRMTHRKMQNNLVLKSYLLPILSKFTHWPYSNSLRRSAFALLRLGAGTPATATGATSRSLQSQDKEVEEKTWEYLG